MKALNSGEIYKRYWIFIIYFSVLLSITVLCRFLYLKTYNKYADVLTEKKQKTEFLTKKKVELSVRIDSLNLFMHMLNTKQVKNEAALERAILRIKYDTMNELEGLEAEGVKDFTFYKRVLANVEMMLDAKKTLNQSLQEEEVNKKKLMECNQANNKLRNRPF
ncbi:MAG TPA: hypothetical protein VL947_05565 [Cytophagales bacterium]|nr:hypothetical protein [Cytophagales bacterium]